MTDRTPVTTVAELETLDEADIMDGYWSGFHGEPEPGDNRSKAFWHGWRNGHHDHTGKGDAASAKLAHEVVQSGYLKRLARGGSPHD